MRLQVLPKAGSKASEPWQSIWVGVIVIALSSECTSRSLCSQNEWNRKLPPSGQEIGHSIADLCSQVSGAARVGQALAIGSNKVRLAGCNYDQSSNSPCNSAASPEESPCSPRLCHVLLPQQHSCADTAVWCWHQKARLLLLSHRAHEGLSCAGQQGPEGRQEGY